MKKVIATLLTVLFMGNINAQTLIKLGEDNSEITIYLPEDSVNKHKAVIVCPGGGYNHLAMQHEGHQVAEWLKEQGYAGIVLKYRLPEKQYKNFPLEDVQNAFRYVRSQAKEWNIKKVGIAGFSAGGHLAATASTHYTDSIIRPDFSILVYPVISMEKEFRHEGSCISLLGNNPSETDLYNYSNEKQINAQTPPAILLLSDDDKTVVPQNSILYYQALKRNNISATLYIFPTGGHGWGMKNTFQYKKEMLTLLKSWLDDI
ncbi:Acetylxylan esterase [termite gut metagenome]|uniref:Acetylxylan esterase n=1 Tax=termite gut metagenome TaxID=433724 RepID=A0A5J4S545_9ZZZZ